jgi:tRNA(Arg) A34 adenosine deaminase TadA
VIKSVQDCGFPAGAIVVKDGQVIGEGISLGKILHDSSSHAETAAIRAACQKLKTADLSGAVLYESMESCNMCFSVAFWAGISKVVYGCRKTPEMVKKYFYEGSTGNESLNNQQQAN